MDRSHRSPAVLPTPSSTVTGLTVAAAAERHLSFPSLFGGGAGGLPLSSAAHYTHPFALHHHGGFAQAAVAGLQREQQSLQIAQRHQRRDLVQSEGMAAAVHAAAATAAAVRAQSGGAGHRTSAVAVRRRVSIAGTNGGGSMDWRKRKTDGVEEALTLCASFEYTGSTANSLQQAGAAGDDADVTAEDYSGNGDGNAALSTSSLGAEDGGVRERDSSFESATAEPHKKKQKRNKPTLSCFECVERKTKCDRGRPHCLACIKRQTDCKYAHVANLLEETTRNAANARRMLKAPKKKAEMTNVHTIPNAADRSFNVGRVRALGSVATSTGLLSNVPFSSPGSSNVFGIGSEHPFANYWTCQGGLAEVISILPDKLQADILLDRYFECVDPVYPMLHRQTFYADYEHFWALSPPEKEGTDPTFAALLLVMLALGTQFVPSTSPGERKQTAEFYASASNQALRMSSYLSMASIRSIQAMVLITYFLINDNHASDGWAFAGILTRQAYAMGLHRDPNIVVPHASPFEKQQRRKVWQAVLLQDTFLTVLLSLPPNATHTDVSVDDLTTDGASIANDDPTDTAYVRGSWTLANLVQEAICSPRSLDVPICATARHKSKLVADFRAVYRSFPDAFRSWDPDALARLAQTNKRVVRQTLFLSSNYFHNLMLVHASESRDVPVNIRGTLEAAHDAITTFFVLFQLFEAEARVWWVFNHRAFLEALCIGNVLREVASEEGGEELLLRDPLMLRAKSDIHQMIRIMQMMSEGEQASETARTRVDVLREFL